MNLYNQQKLNTKKSSATLAQWVTHLPRNTKDIGSNPGIGIHCGSDDHLKWWSSVIGSYSHWPAKEPKVC